MVQGSDQNRINYQNSNESGGFEGFLNPVQPQSTLFHSNDNADDPSTSSHTSETISKKIKISNDYIQQEIEVSSSEETSVLGLRLRKTPSFLNCVKLCLNQARNRNDDHIGSDGDCRENIYGFLPNPTPEKFKASNFPALILKIGPYEKFARHEGDVLAKCYYKKQKLMWEVLDGELKNRFEIPWADIDAIRAIIRDGQPGILEIQLLRPPLFYREDTLKRAQHSLWQPREDFTQGAASKFRRHYLRFPPGTLNKQYEKLMQCDQRLFMLSQKPFPSRDSPYFSSNLGFPDNFEHLGSYGPEIQFSPPMLHNLQSPFSSNASSSLLSHHHFQNFQPTSTQHYGPVASYSPIGAINQNFDHNAFGSIINFLGIEDYEIQQQHSSANAAFLSHQNSSNQMSYVELSNTENHFMGDSQSTEGSTLQQFEEPMNYNNNHIGVNQLRYIQDNFGDENQSNLSNNGGHYIGGGVEINYPQPLQWMAPQNSSNEEQLMNLQMKNNNYSYSSSHDFSNPTGRDWHHF